MELLKRAELNDQEEEEESEEVIDVKPKVKGKVSKIVVEETTT